MPPIGATVRYGKVLYRVVGHYCGGSYGLRCHHGEFGMAAYRLDKAGNEIRTGGTLCLDARQVEEVR